MTGGLPFGHPWMGGLFDDPDTEVILAPDAQIAHMRAIEAAFSLALGAVGRVPPEIAAQAARHIRTVPLNLEDLRAGTKHDGLVVPALVRQLKAGCSPDILAAIHTGLTSQDVLDTALILSLRDICALFRSRLDELTDALEVLCNQHGCNALMGRTRMQLAEPIQVKDRLRVWIDPLRAHLKRLDEIEPRLLVLQYGGAVGTRQVTAPHGDEVAAFLARELGLPNPPASWHPQRDTLAEFASWLSLVTGTLGKMGQDVVLMAQQGLDEIALSGGGGSSAMPHKKNPILAELLVTLARFNATQLAGMHQALVHEQERSGIAWALEWMILPPMIMATGRALTASVSVVASVERIGTPEPAG